MSSGRVGEERHELPVHLEERARPAVGEHDGHRTRAAPALVEEVETKPSTSARKWWKAFSFASCARQSNPSRQ